MINKIQGLIDDVDQFVPAGNQELEAFRIKYLGKKGIINSLFEEFKQLDPAFKKETGKWLNILKGKVSEKIEFYKINFDKQKYVDFFKGMDLSMEAHPLKAGSRHPVNLVKTQIIDIFSRIGFTLSTGPEIVDDWHNFTALNFPPDHPARDMQDTLYLNRNPDILLRTHTSSIQVQEMQANRPPIRTISIGRVYRNETISYKSHVQFHQIEGLYIDKNVSFADLKQVLYYFVEQFFGSDFKIRFRPSFFPFTEPSAEMDIGPAHGETKWMEIMGCGMVDPAVLDNCGIDSNEYTGYAFGIGIERLTMLKYGIPDIRILFENDVRFLEQFCSQ